MATASDIAKEVAKHFEKIAAASKTTDDNWSHIGRVIESSSRQFDTGFLKAASSFTGLYPTIKNVGMSIASAFTGSTRHIDSLKDTQRMLENARRRAKGNTDLTDDLRDQVNAVKAQIKASKALTVDITSIVNSKWTIAAMAFAGQLKLAFAYSRQINEQLIQTSANYADRARFAQQISQVQAATGNEMQDMAKGAAALANYGFDLRDGFKDTLKTVVLMEEGLGISYETSSQMVVAVKRIGGDFHKVADTLARIKADTALSADEATRFATQISKAVMMLKPGSGGLVDQTTDYVSRMAAALKELTGDGKGFVDMMASFTTEAGMMGAATLGASPDFLSDPAQTKLVTERFVKYVNQQLSGTSGFQRMATIQLLSEQFNTSADVIANADEMMKKYNATLKGNTTLEDEWRNQTSEFNKSLKKMYSSLSAIIQQTLIPLIRVLNPLFEGLTTALQWVAKSGAALYVGIGLLSLSALGAAIAVKKLTLALWSYASSAGIIGSFGKAGGAVGSTAVGFLSKISGILAKIAAVVTGPIALGVAGIAATAVMSLYVGNLIGKHTKFGAAVMAGWLEILSKGDAHRSAMLSTHGRGITKQDFLNTVTAMAASGLTVDAIQKYIMDRAPDIKGFSGATQGKLSTPEGRAEIMAGILQEAGLAITRQRVRMGHTTLTAQTAEDKATQEKFIELFSAIARNSEFTNKLLERAEKSAQLNAEYDRSIYEEQAEEVRLKRQKDRRIERLSDDLKYLP